MAEAAERLAALPGARHVSVIAMGARGTRS